MFEEIIFVYCENHKKDINALIWGICRMFRLTARSMCKNHHDLKSEHKTTDKTCVRPGDRFLSFSAQTASLCFLMMCNHIDQVKFAEYQLSLFGCDC